MMDHWLFYRDTLSTFPRSLNKLLRAYESIAHVKVLEFAGTSLSHFCGGITTLPVAQLSVGQCMPRYATRDLKQQQKDVRNPGGKDSISSRQLSLIFGTEKHKQKDAGIQVGGILFEAGSFS